MSKSTIGKIVQAVVLALGFCLMIANNMYRAFDFIPYGTYVVFIGFFGLWLVIAVVLSNRGYFDWWGK